MELMPLSKKHLFQEILSLHSEELIENPDEMLYWYNSHSDIFSRFNYTLTSLLPGCKQVY